MKHSRTKHYAEAMLAGLLLATYSLPIIATQVQALAKQEVHLEQIHTELQSMLDQITIENDKREQSSMSLRDFSDTTLFSCRGLT